MKYEVKPLDEKELIKINNKYNSYPMSMTLYKPIPKLYKEGVKFYKFTATSPEDERMNLTTYYMSDKPDYKLYDRAEQLLQAEHVNLIEQDYDTNIEEIHPYETDMTRIFIDQDINLRRFLN